MVPKRPTVTVQRHTPSGFTVETVYVPKTPPGVFPEGLSGNCTRTSQRTGTGEDDGVEVLCVR